VHCKNEIFRIYYVSTIEEKGVKRQNCIIMAIGSIINYYFRSQYNVGRISYFMNLQTSE